MLLENIMFSLEQNQSEGKLLRELRGSGPQKWEKGENMKNFARLFVVKDGEFGGWTCSTRTSFVISVNNNELSVVHKAGRLMFAAEVNTAFGRFLHEYERETGERVAHYQRKNPYRFCYREGMSGCQDVYVEIDKGDGFPDRKYLLHETCHGKTSGFRCFVYDFLDLCIAGGFFVIEDGFYTYHEEDDSYADLEAQIVRPRLTENEEGWTQPYSRPQEVVLLKMVRDTPQDDKASQK